ncbi:MAG: glutamine synthetase adenylyltransferase [Rhodothermia bacterium]
MDPEPGVRQDNPFDASVLERINSPDPERVAIQFNRFSERLQSDPELAEFCFGDARRIDMLATLLGGSAFISDILIREPELFRTLAHDQADARMRVRASERTAVEMERAVHAAVASAPSYDDQKIALRRFHRRELFRIAASDFLGFWDMPAVTGQLSILAGSLIRTALDVAAGAVGIVPAGLAIVGMGKLGGLELNYSSDIDLLFVAGSDAMRYSRVGARVIDVLGDITSEGFLYRVDMRLRPWGRSGALVNTVDAYEKYLKSHGEPWEKQALLKARVLAGNTVVGQEFYDRLSPIVFGQTPESVRKSVVRMKRRIEAELDRKGQTWGNVKQGRGSIRDVEFTVQFLQLLHGGSMPGVRSESTRVGLARLSEHGLLSQDDLRILSEGYTFLRVIEHHLQLYHNRQTHSLPRDSERIDHLARRLEFDDPDPGKQLLGHYEQHASAIRQVFERLVAKAGNGDVSVNNGENNETSLPPLVTTMAPAYQEAFSRREIDRHAILARRLNHRHPVAVEAQDLEDGTWRLTIVGYDYLGELSVISGLLLVHGFDIIDGQIFTDEQRSGSGNQKRPSERSKLKIVDVFTVKPVSGEVPAETWRHYTGELEELVRALSDHRREEVQGRLAERVAESTADRKQSAPSTLYPVDIVIDNETDARFSILNIEAPDTVGFLYELTNALTLLDVDIARVGVTSAGERVRDTLYVTNNRGQKITVEIEQHQLRLTTVLVQHFTHLLPQAPNPTAALLQFRSLLGNLLTRDDWTAEIASLERPEVLDALTRLLGVSDFLWNDFLRMQHETLFPLIGDVDRLKTPRPSSDIEKELADAMSGASDTVEQITLLNRLKDHEMFRIDMRYILGHITEFGQFSREITDLADVVVNEALRLSVDRVASTAGRPMFEDGSPCPLSVCALGKFGGREMGFASDIELLFVYEARGHSSGPVELTNAQYFDRVAQAFLQTIRAKRDGVFEIDLRLRPYGSTAGLATSLAAFQRYFAVEGAAWPYERQLLLKLRPVAGDPELGHLVVQLRNEILAGIGMFDAGSMRAMRERQLRHLVTPGTLNAKYSPGGLVDIEYLTQALQISYCNRYPDLITHANTRVALGKLLKNGILESTDHEVLDGALILLRRVIDGLRMVRGNARDLDIPASDSQEMLYLSRRLKRDSPSDLAEEVLARMTAVAGIGAKLLG